MAESRIRISPELERNTSAGRPTLILPFRTSPLLAEESALVTGTSAITLPPLARASISKAVPFGTLTVTPPPETFRLEFSLGCATKPTSIAPLVVSAWTDAAAGKDGLAGMKRWPVTVSYFDHAAKAGDQAPLYAISFELYENGISRALLLDYNDFAISGELTSLEIRDTKPCK